MIHYPNGLAEAETAVNALCETTLLVMGKGRRIKELPGEGATNDVDKVTCLACLRALAKGVR